MSFHFEQALRRKCDENPDLSVLQAQWAYDRRLVADALQTIGITFPHYSRHDVSHSSAILVQLARVLGPARTDALSATDLWLLLEAAYQHDIGMVVTDKQAKEWLSSRDFNAHLDRLLYNEDRELAQAGKLIAGTEKLERRTPHWSIEVRRALTLVLADFGRRNHPRNAERIVRDPVATIGLLSPRTPLIPDRLFKVLGAICAHHGRSFEETMLLPFRESGVGTDDAHPRFVACMLRLGDLLDLDNGRFCPVMMSSFGPLPPSSLAHVEKHASILHLQIGPTRIEVEAECENYASYEAADQWLTWLRDELKNQMARWVEIVPSANFGALPSAGRIGARLRQFLELEPGRRPRFEVDREAIITLVKGANLYDEPFSCIRELLQNAVDATILRLWRERWSRRPKVDLEGKLEPDDLREALKVWPIRVRIKRIRPKKGADKVRWRISVRDRGTGIDFSDIQYLQRIGGSSKNERKRREIASMPEWMRPSGIFGIGLQSVFMFTSKAVLTTRHHETHKVYKIVLQNGSEPGTDGLLIQAVEGEQAAHVKVGTTVEFDLEFSRIPTWRELRQGLSRNMGAWTAVKFDFLADEECPAAATRILESAHDFAQVCLATVEVAASVVGGVRSRPAMLSGVSHFDRETGTAIFGLRPTEKLGPGGDWRVSYRGAPVTNIYGLDGIVGSCDVYFGRADEILRLNREGLTDHGHELIWNGVRSALGRAFPAYIADLRSRGVASGGDEVVRALRLSSLWGRAHGGFAKSVFGDEWGELRIGGTNNVALRDLIKESEVAIEVGEMYDDRIDRIVVKPGPPVTLCFGDDDGVRWATRLFRETHLLSYHGWARRGARKSVEVYRLSAKRGAHDPVSTPEALRDILGMLLSDDFWMWTRATLPCPLRYRALRFSPEADPPQSRDLVPTVSPRMLCPFALDDKQWVTIAGLRKFVEWTAKNADASSASEREVAEALWAFLQEADQLMAEPWKKRKAYELNEAKRELSRWLGA